MKMDLARLTSLLELAKFTKEKYLEDETLIIPEDFIDLLNSREKISILQLNRKIISFTDGLELLKYRHKLKYKGFLFKTITSDMLYDSDKYLEEVMR